MDDHYDSLLEEDPDIQELQVKAEVQGLQQLALEAVEDQYPSLLPLAQERVIHIKQSTLLRQLVKLIFKAPDEKTVHWLLETYTA